MNISAFRKAFRDALAEAGTGPALVEIYNAIERKEISGGEAARIVSRLPVVAREPTPEYMSAFFVSFFILLSFLKLLLKRAIRFITGQ